MFNLDVQVVENPSNLFKRVRSLDTRQKDICFQNAAVSPSVRASSVELFEPECDQKSDLPGRACTGTRDTLICGSVVLTSDVVSLPRRGTHIRRGMATRFPCHVLRVKDSSASQNHGR